MIKKNLPKPLWAVPPISYGRVEISTTFPSLIISLKSFVTLTPGNCSLITLWTSSSKSHTISNTLRL